MKVTVLTLAGFLAGSVVAFAATPAAPSAAPKPVPLFAGLGSHSFKVTTSSPDAQKYFDQGLRLVFGFNHGAAIRSFQEAARLDPDCAMAHWGVALASGPHINFPVVPPPAAELAWAELTLARRHRAGATPVERALIDALAQRYADPQPEDRGGLDRAYADAMRGVWKQFPKHADVGVFFAESMMDLRPWDQWTPDGAPQPGTDEILATLDAVLKLDVNHPFANHLYIHAVEASHHPERADAAAKRLLNLQPGLAHNVHMPSHIDIRRGRWHEAIVANLRAVEADRKHREAVGPARGFLPVYVAHNRHMLAYAAMMTGQRRLALEHIRALVAGLPAEFMGDFGAMVAETWVATPTEILVRFGRWDEVLAEPAPKEAYLFSTAFHHAARGIAFAAKGDTANARAEQELFLAAAKLVPPEELAAGNNTCRTIIGIVTPMLEGEILVRAGRLDDGLAQLRAAVAAEDRLKYDEPPGWMIPVRHALGAALMKYGRLAEAEQVYRDDLQRLPDNGWSLFGLSESLRLQGKTKDAKPVRARFEKMWSKADEMIASSCYCQAGT